MRGVCVSVCTSVVCRFPGCSVWVCGYGCIFGTHTYVCNTFFAFAVVLWYVRMCIVCVPQLPVPVFPRPGKVSLEDIVFPKDQCQEKFQQCTTVVVYDECTADPGSVSPTNALSVVLESLALKGKTPYMLVGKCRRDCPPACRHCGWKH